ncbi:hypothetical protein TWF481_000697 [Arthrobotrys musiformis]|uniref:CFEM domain-containing protein n=1 Tax=Arthrobotrys musiformis TaxID=47236 RepID=A0AAV9WNG9_9PEZI
MKGAIQFLGALAAVQAVSATYIDWTQPFNSYDCGGKKCGGREKFEPPAYSNERCTPQQSTGYDFSDAPTGDLPKYDDFDFSGYKCKQSSLQRRSGRGSGNKCASSYVEPETYSNEIKCGKKFSVEEFDISVERESVIEFHYGMPDGSTCKHVSTCGTGITPIKNTQCGGAKSVKCKIHKSSKNKKKCGFNIHHIKFRCDNNPTTTTTPVPATTEPAPCTEYSCTATDTTTEVAPTTTEEAPCTEYSCTATDTTTEAVPTTTEEAPCTEYSCTATDTTTEAVPTTTDEAPCTEYSCTATDTTTEALPTTTEEAPCTEYSCTATDTTTEALPTTTEEAPCTEYSCTATDTTTEAVPTTTDEAPCTEYSCTATDTTTEAVPTTTDEAPCTEYSCTATETTTEAVPTEAVPTEEAPCTEYSCTGVPTSEAVPTTSEDVPTTTDVYVPPTDVYVPPLNTSIPYETPSPSETETVPPSGTDVYTTLPSVPVETGCPPVLPQCMETWTKITECVNSGDVKCLCPNPEYIKSVAACVEAWGVDDDEVSKALEYMQGLCAEHIPENPAIVTCVPTYVTLPPVTTGASTITVSTTVVVPCTTASPEETTQPGYVPSYTTETIVKTVTVCPVKLVTTEPSKPVLVPGTITAPAYIPPTAPATIPATVPAEATTVAATTPVEYLPSTMMTAYPTVPVPGPANTTTPSPPIATGAASSFKAFSTVLLAGVIGLTALIMA